MNVYTEIDHISLVLQKQLNYTSDSFSIKGIKYSFHIINWRNKNHSLFVISKCIQTSSWADVGNDCTVWWHQVKYCTFHAHSTTVYDINEVCSLTPDIKWVFLNTVHIKGIFTVHSSYQCLSSIHTIIVLYSSSTLGSSTLVPCGILAYLHSHLLYTQVLYYNSAKTKNLQLHYNQI